MRLRRELVGRHCVALFEARMGVEGATPKGTAELTPLEAFVFLSFFAAIGRWSTIPMSPATWS